MNRKRTTGRDRRNWPSSAVRRAVTRPLAQRRNRPARSRRPYLAAAQDQVPRTEPSGKAVVRPAPKRLRTRLRDNEIEVSLTIFHENGQVSSCYRSGTADVFHLDDEASWS